MINELAQTIFILLIKNNPDFTDGTIYNNEKSIVIKLDKSEEFNDKYKMIFKNKK